MTDELTYAGKQYVPKSDYDLLVGERDCLRAEIMVLKTEIENLMFELSEV